MIIVNQEKTYLVNFNNVCQVSLAVDEEETEYAIAVQTVDKEEIIMGIYKTEERAKEVLQEIIKVYKFYNGKTYLVEDSNNLIGKYQYGVYEMPEEGDYEK